MLSLLVALQLISYVLCKLDQYYVDKHILGNPFMEKVKCQGRENLRAVRENPKCLSKFCGRSVIDGKFTPENVQALRAIAEKAMGTRPANGGPTILDINTGFIRDSNGLDNLFSKENKILTAEDFAVYGNIIAKLKSLVENTFNISNLYFTAPTFITRLDHRVEWVPSDIHDEYWHPHADMLNTGHYQYSGLLYLSDYQAEFNGGLLRFVEVSKEGFQELEDMQTLYIPTEKTDTVMTVEPIAGRVAIFSSGPENFHYVDKVTSGQRFVLAFWFTCEREKEMKIYLDGAAHYKFAEKLGNSYRKQEAQRTANSDL